MSFYIHEDYDKMGWNKEKVLDRRSLEIGLNHLFEAEVPNKKLNAFYDLLNPKYSYVHACVLDSRNKSFMRLCNQLGYEISDARQVIINDFGNVLYTHNFYGGTKYTVLNP